MKKTITVLLTIALLNCCNHENVTQLSLYHNDDFIKNLTKNCDDPGGTTVKFTLIEPVGFDCAANYHDNICPWHIDASVECTTDGVNAIYTDYRVGSGNTDIHSTRSIK